MDREAWHAIVHGVAKSRMWLSNWTDWLIFDLQCCVNFRYIAKWFHYTYINVYIFFSDSFPYSVSKYWVQFSHSVGLTLCNPMDCSTPNFPVHHQLLELAQTHVHGVSDAIQPSHPLSSPSPPDLNPSQHQGLFQWVSSSHQVAKVLEFQLQHQSFQWRLMNDLL